jgi:hypothetical protein
MKDIYKLISSKAKKRTSFENSEEYAFYLQHKYLLAKVNKFAFANVSSPDDFDIMRINILLHSAVNKEIIEREIISLAEYIKDGKKVVTHKFLSTLREKILDLPYLQDGKNKIYMPIFSRAMNQIYMKEPQKLLEYPYNQLINEYKESMIDPFDIYGYELYNSYFTRLVLLGVSPNKKEAAYFHYDLNTIYFINDQGRLDRTLVLFDKYMKNPSTSHMLERLKPLVDAYFAFDKEAFIDALVKGKFISKWMLSLIKER